MLEATGRSSLSGNYAQSSLQRSWPCIPSWRFGLEITSGILLRGKCLGNIPGENCGGIVWVFSPGKTSSRIIQGGLLGVL